MSFINVITTSGKKHRIDEAKEINRGGEGIIYDIGSDIVAKIYHPGIEVLQQKKFDFLNKLDKNLFICPLELLYAGNANAGAVVGYTMPYLKPEYYPLTNLYTKSFCAAHGIDNKVKLKVIEGLIKAVEYAHSMKVVVGDLNCLNIMVNDKGSIKLIDTDSYETPGFKHSGRLLEDIRDFLYQGRINFDSDFFALSILAFNMLTFIHPFKGIHKKYLKLSDRMIHKIPVFVNDSDLKLPKCYEEIKDRNLMAQFEKFYIKGERFALSLGNVASTTVVVTPKPTLVKHFTQDQLNITDISGTHEIINVHTSESFLVLETASDFYFYNAKNKTYVTLMDSVSKKNFEQVFVGEKNIILRKDKNIFVYSGPGNYTQITSCILPEQFLIQQYGNILVVVSHEKMTKLFIDEVFSTVMKSSVSPVFGKGFKKYNSFIYNSGGKQIMFYNPRGIELSLMNVPVKIEDLYQEKNIGMIQYLKNESIKYKFFKTKDLNITFASDDTNHWSHFAYKPGKDGEGMIFKPADNAIKVIRIQDFAEIQELKCDLSSTDSVIRNTSAGLILFDDNKVWLLNKK